MANLVNIAGDGLPIYLWEKFAKPGQTPWEVGLERATLGLGGFAFSNTVVREDQGAVATCLIGCPRDSTPPSIAAEISPILVPLQELGTLVTESWFINILATYPQCRGKGFATDLLQIADSLARDAGCTQLSLIVSDANTPARRLYTRNGYTDLATRPIVKESWIHPGQNWVLMIKNI